MSDRKRVLVALRPSDFSMPSMLQGLHAYLLTHPDMNVHFCLLAPEMGATVQTLRTMIESSPPDGVLAHVFWKRSELRLGPGTQLVNLEDDLPPEYPTVNVDQKRA